MRHLAGGTVLAATAALAAPGRVGARQCRPGHAPRGGWGTSRPLLYMHLDRLEKAGLVTGQLELSDDGKAMK